MSASTRAERARWQRFAVQELTTILHTHPDLPIIAWTISPAGSVLVGHIDEHTARAKDAAEVFHAWQQALMLTTDEQASLGGITYLAAAADRGRVRVRLRAVVAETPGEPRW